MFADPITLAGDSSSTRDYKLRSIVSGNSERANAAAPANELETMAIKHSRSTKNGTVIKRHLVRLDLGKVNSTTQVLQTAGVYAVLEVPTDSAITSTMIKDMVTQLKNFLTAGNVSALINEEP
jgi:hypothetical protein